MKLTDNDIRTREVLDWKGLHLFHFQASSCSQKVRIFLNLKSIPWTSHPINIVANENMKPYYLGINPRGLVPTMVLDGEVHIESNDIMVLLDHLYPDNPLIPASHEADVAELLRHEDDLHLDLRTISFRFLMNPDKPPKSAEDLANYATGGSGTVGGNKDVRLQEEIAFWQGVINQGIPDADVRRAVSKFMIAFQGLEAELADSSYLFGGQKSVLDIAWLVYAHRLVLAGYPLQRLHPRLHHWLTDLARQPAVAPEIALPPPVAEAVAARAAFLKETGAPLADVCQI